MQLQLQQIEQYYGNIALASNVSTTMKQIVMLYWKGFVGFHHFTNFMLIGKL
jgi:hypothetical protein